MMINSIMSTSTRLLSRGIRALLLICIGVILSGCFTLWSAHQSAEMAGIHDIVYAEGLFVAVGAEGRIFTSSDGARWTASRHTSRRDLYAIAYGDGRFVAVGDGATIFTSEDAAVWIASANVVNRSDAVFTSIAYGNGRFVAAGDGVTITQPYPH